MFPCIKPLVELGIHKPGASYFGKLAVKQSRSDHGSDGIAGITPTDINVSVDSSTACSIKNYSPSFQASSEKNVISYSQSKPRSMIEKYGIIELLTLEILRFPSFTANGF